MIDYAEIYLDRLNWWGWDELPTDDEMETFWQYVLENEDEQTAERGEPYATA